MLVVRSLKGLSGTLSSAGFILITAQEALRDSFVWSQTQILLEFIRALCIL